MTSVDESGVPMLAVTDLETGRVYWTATQCAAHSQVSPSHLDFFASHGGDTIADELIESTSLHWRVREVSLTISSGLP
ncbi:hypothetical protein ACUY2R_07225 [Corynebacterium mastitidis]